MKTGFIVGKFYPFHLGHMYLLDVARANCDKLIVWVCEKANQTVLGHIRAAWIAELYPDVDVRLVPDTLKDDDTAGWADYTVRVLGKAPDVVFTSEDYGEPYAMLMGSKHVCVDRGRFNVPISGTKIRNDTYANWMFLAPPVRAHFAKRVVVLGAESTGTTTFAKALADHYKTVWVPEYGRDYCLYRKEFQTRPWTTDEFVHIASEQARREDEMARNANRILICDTDPFATTIWHKRYLNTYAPEVEKIASHRNYDLYIVTGDEIPFEQDGTRDGEHIRHEMQQWFIEKLKNENKPYIIVTGTIEKRMKEALEHIDKLF